MIRFFLLCIVFLLSLSVATDAALMVKVTRGEISVVGKNTSGKKVFTDSVSVESGDSLFLSAEQQATILLEKNSRALCKGPLTAIVMIDKSEVKIAIDDGQIFLDRNLPYEYSSVQILTKGYVFFPLGTAAAVRAVRNSHPETAVLRGKVKMQSPTGESIVVNFGNFGSVDQNGNLLSGKLDQDAINALEEWGNVKLDNELLSAQTNENIPVQTAVSELPSSSIPQSQDVDVSDNNSKAVVATGVTSQTDAQSSSAVSPASDAPVQDNSLDDQKTDDNQNLANEKTQQPDAVAETGSKPVWEINAGTSTVNNQQWTRLAVGVDVPIWKFGVFFDIEMFIDNRGKLSNKGWNFKDDWVDAVTRKIRYIRFGHEQDPFFTKFGGLSSVSLGYGFLVDRFTNMLHYPDQKLLGLQCNLNDIGPIGITLQTLVADFKDFKNDGGVMAARLAIAPLKMSDIPIVKGITVGGTYAVDLNQYAPARDWQIDVPSSLRMYQYLRTRNIDSTEAVDSIISIYNSDPRLDSLGYSKEKNASKAADQFGLVGADIGVPLVRSALVNVDLYGQAGFREDQEHGWGIGAPGLSLKLWQLWAGIEYRHIQGRFAPGYFGTYYLDERLQRVPEIVTKEARLPDAELDGIFGRLGFNIANVLIIDGSYQYMVGKKDTDKDQRFEIASSLGDLIINKIPRLTKAEVYYQKSNIGTTIIGKDYITNKYEYDSFFDKTPYMYYGYRVGIGIAQGASLIFDTRFGFKRGSDGYKMLPDNNVNVQTAITF